jgi:hypothetical protein
LSEVTLWSVLGGSDKWDQAGEGEKRSAAHRKALHRENVQLNRAMSKNVKDDQVRMETTNRAAKVSTLKKYVHWPNPPAAQHAFSPRYNGRLPATLPYAPYQPRLAHGS